VFGNDVGFAALHVAQVRCKMGFEI